MQLTFQVETRDRQVEKPGLGSQTSTDTVTLPGVDDGGKVRILRSLTKATIPSDGRPYRVPLFSIESEAKIEYILIPDRNRYSSSYQKRTN